MSSKSFTSVAEHSHDAAHPRGDGAPKAHSSFRMHASSSAQRARMRRWIEAKHRRQEIDDDDSLMSIVTTGDEEPKPMDPDDAAYRGRVPSRSRIGTIQSYREAHQSLKKTRKQDRAPPPPAHSDHRRAEGASSGRAHSKPVKSYPVVYSSDDDFDYEARTSGAKRRRTGLRASYDGDEADATPTSKRTRGAGSRHPTPPPLESEEDLPSVLDLVSGRRSASTVKNAYRRSAGDSVRRRLFHRDEENTVQPTVDSLFDEEAEEVDDEGRPVKSWGEMDLDPNEYDYGNPFIDDSPLDAYDGASDSSMHSDYSREVRRRRSGRRGDKVSRRLDSPFRPTSKDVKAAGRAKPFPLAQEVVEISSGSEYEVARVPRSKVDRNSGPVVKIERSPEPELPKPRPQPRPVLFQAKVEPPSSLTVPAPKESLSIPPKLKGVPGSLRPPSGPSTPAPLPLQGKGKARAADDDQPSKSPATTGDEGRLHPDEEKELERAIEESRKTALGSSPTAGESSQQGASSSSVRPPPPTPSPSGGRLRMADLVASATPAESTSASPSTPTPEMEDTTTSRRCTSLPEVCEVWDPALMDVILRSNYTGLPNLRAGILIPWSERAGKGNMRFSKVAYDAMNFVKSANIQNPSRSSPLDIVLRTVPQSTNRYNFYVNTTPPLPLIATSCVFLDTSQLVSPSDKGLRQKYLIGNFHSYEWQRFCAFVRTASGYPSLHAQLARDCLQFLTRAGQTRTPSSDDNSNSPSPTGKRATPADMFQVAAGRSSSNRVAADTFSLANDAIVPVYDARTFESLDFGSVLPRLSDTLPVYTGGELPYGAFVMVGYTITIYRAGSGNWTLGCNLLWAILIGSPHD